MPAKQRAEFELAFAVETALRQSVPPPHEAIGCHGPIWRVRFANQDMLAEAIEVIDVASRRSGSPIGLGLQLLVEYLITQPLSGDYVLNVARDDDGKTTALRQK